MTAHSPIVGVIDYGAGNLKSIVNSFDYLGAAVRRVGKGDTIDNVTHLVLPGVGAFGYCSHMLTSSGLIDVLTRWALVERKPTLGICVGMQLMTDSSDELGMHFGLGWCSGEVRKLGSGDAKVRVPHVGWNDVIFDVEFGEFKSGDSADFYFDHSYALKTPAFGQRVASCTHGESFCAVVRRDNVVAAQFHPEKSQAAGMRFLRSFLALQANA